MAFNKPNKSKKEDLSKKYIINDGIKLKGDVRIVGNNIASKVISIEDARNYADENDLDLVLINDGSNAKDKTPIIMLCDYEKFIYNMKKEAKKKNVNVKPMKEIQLRANIAKHDLETKANAAKKFLMDGSKVKIVLTLKGREMARKEENKRPMLELIVMLEDYSAIEASPKELGNRTIAILKPKKIQQQNFKQSFDKGEEEDETSFKTSNQPPS